jgi:hypothetical protein
VTGRPAGRGAGQVMMLPSHRAASVVSVRRQSIMDSGTAAACAGFDDQLTGESDRGTASPGK